MSSKVIPAKTVMTCDRCGDVGEKSGAGAFAYGGMHMKVEHWARSFQGDAGGTSYELDLCPSCIEGFKKFLKEKGDKDE